MTNAAVLHVSKTRIDASMLLAKGTLIGTKPGFSFYEHPFRGDEAGLLVVRKNQVFQTSEYDLPDFDIAGVRILPGY